MIMGIGGGGVVDPDAVEAVAGAVEVAAGGISPPACGGGEPPEAPSILLLALSILAFPSGLSAIASCILILHAFVWPALCPVPCTTARHPGHPGVAPWLSTSCL